MASPKTMKAYQHSGGSGGSGGMDKAIRLVDNLPIPQVPALDNPTKPSVLVAVSAVSLNPADYKIPESRLLTALLLHKPSTPCLDFTGRIVQLPQPSTSGSSASKDLEGLKLGDLVIARHSWFFAHGALAQYSLAQPNGLVKLPEGVTPEQGAALGTAGLTAIQSLQPWLRRGDRVFLNGGSGGVGTFSIQIAKLLGAEHVTVSCSGANAQLCRDLGADEVVDYRAGDVVGQLKAVAEKVGRPFDHIVDNVGNLSRVFEESEAYLREGGTYVQVAGSADSVGAIVAMVRRTLLPTWLGGVNRKWTSMIAKNDNEALGKMAGWIAEGKLKVIIDSEYSFEDADKAFAKLKSGRARGKILIDVAGSK